MMTPSFGSRTTCDQVLANRDLSGRAMLVTGANAGIGFETSRSLAAAGAHVLLGCRTKERAEETAERIRGEVPNAQLTPVECDLGSFASVRRCTKLLPLERLDVAICNAGILPGYYEETEDGIEATVGICHFGHFLLIQGVLAHLRRAAPSRIVMVSSESHRSPRTLDFERFPLTREDFRPLAAYGQAKLCNVLFARELFRRHGADGISTSSLHPGALIGTRLFRRSFAAQLLAWTARPFVKSIAQGAATTVYCATAPELEGIGGRYYADCREKRASRGACDDKTAAKLWELSVARVGAG